MPGVFQNIDPHPPHRPASVCSPRLWCGGGRTHSLGGEEGGEGQYFGSRQTQLCTVLYICKYFVAQSKEICLTLREKEAGK